MLILKLFDKVEREEMFSLILNYIEENNGMSASVSVIGRALDPEYGWRDFSIYGYIIDKLKDRGSIEEIDGRYYIVSKTVS